MLDVWFFLSFLNILINYLKVLVNYLTETLEVTSTETMEITGTEDLIMMGQVLINLAETLIGLFS